MRGTLRWMGRLAVVVLAGAVGGMIGRNFRPDARVHAQEKLNMGCKLTVPRSWGDYKGGSDYGLAFQDSSGTLRFVLHPDCSNMRTYSDYGGYDLELERR